MVWLRICATAAHILLRYDTRLRLPAFYHSLPPCAHLYRTHTHTHAHAAPLHTVRHTVSAPRRITILLLAVDATLLYRFCLLPIPLPVILTFRRTRIYRMVRLAGCAFTTFILPPAHTDCHTGDARAAARPPCAFAFAARHTVALAHARLNRSDGMLLRCRTAVHAVAVRIFAATSILSLPHRVDISS